MNINELDSYDLGDAVKFNRRLNPRLWTEDERLRPEVREKLLLIAEDFAQSLGVSDLELQDITISGSNAAYTYTPHSDLDLHLVVDLPEADRNEVYRELFDAKKYQYNDQHNIVVGGADVELYVENANAKPVSQGIYSVLRDEWIDVPKRRRPRVDDMSVKSKFEDLGHRIEAAIDSGDYERMDAMARKLKQIRQAGLAETGEFGPENLAYKILRTQGLIKRLYDARTAARDAELSLKERRAPRSVFRYGFRHPAEEARVMPEATEPEEKSLPSDEEILQDFIDFCVKELKISQLPQIKLRRDPEWPRVNKTFGRYNNDKEMLEVAWGNRHIMDVLRTVAHELTHRHQHERDGSRMGPAAGETGSPYENEANARAGILMRDYARLHPEYFTAGQANELSVEEGVKEKLGALAAAACIAGTPGCATTTDPVGQGLRTVQDVGRTAQTVKNMGRAGVQAELEQELRNYIRAQGGDAGSQNLSQLYQLQKKLQNKDAVKEASGYIPTKKQARDPRFSMALTKDVRPGAVGKEANKLALKTDSQGHPDLLIKGLKNALREFKETGRVSNKLDSLGNQTPPGPEFRPTMPAGTVRVDVSDMYDWYKLGQHIANMKGLGQHDFGAGPPSTIVSFGDEDTEHRFIGDLEATGLDVTDIDPRDPVQRAGKAIKTDPAYNVDESDQQLDEVKMSPSALAKFASSPEAEGIRAGFEAELIFRDAQRDEDEGEMEPDYDADERPYSIQHVIDFFTNDDYGYGLTDRQANRLREQLDEAYFEWRDDQIIRDFEREAEDLVREVWLEERPMIERIHSALTDGMGLDDDEADKIIAIGEKAPRFTRTSDQTAYKEENEGYEQYLEAVNIADEILDEEVEASVTNQDGYYDQALDNFRDGYDEDDGSFFSDMGWRWMSDVANEFNLDWPVVTGSSEGSGGRSWDEIASSLQDATGMRVRTGGGYHSIKRGDYYVIEPDGSLDPDDYDDAGLEIVSPPMPLNQAIEQLQTVIDWANGAGNAYTNSSTGLHMGVSIPFKGGNVDYLKLILFMGDKYVLDKFGRAANTYTASAMEKLKQNVAGSKNRNDDKIASAMELMKNNLLELAQKYVQQGVGNSKYTSAHIKDGYIEFRSPGGDYLAKADEEIGVLEDTMRRFAYAMYLAGRPDLERPEYYKKLYKLIAPEGNRDLELFSKFSSGEITAEQLKKQWAEKVIAREVPSDNKKSNWRLYNRFTNKPVVGAEFSNFTQTDALERAKAQVSPASSMEDFNKAYELRDVGTNTGRWSVIRRDNGETLEIIDAATRGEASDQARDKYTDVIPFYIEPYGGSQEPAPEPKLSRRAKLAKQIAQPMDYVIINKHSGLPFYTFRASSQSQAVDFGVTYLRNKGLDLENFTVQKAANAKQAADNARDSGQLQQRLEPGNYEFVYQPTGRVLDRVEGITAMQADSVLANVRRRYDDLPADSIVMRRSIPQVRDIDIDVAQNIPDAPRGNYELYVHDHPETVFHRMTNATANQVRDYIAQQERDGMPPGFLRVRTASTNANPTVQQPNQARADNGVPQWELFDRETGSILRTIVDHTQREATQQAMSWLRTIGAEDPDTYSERFAVRPKLSNSADQT